jgi:hypothetical protein
MLRRITTHAPRGVFLTPYRPTSFNALRTYASAAHTSKPSHEPHGEAAHAPANVAHGEHNTAHGAPHGEHAHEGGHDVGGHHGEHGHDHGHHGPDLSDGPYGVLFGEVCFLYNTSIPFLNYPSTISSHVRFTFLYFFSTIKFNRECRCSFTN